jgi:2-aminoadipate transaminase
MTPTENVAPATAPLTQWAERFAQRMAGMKSSAIRELLKLTSAPDIISFGGGLPAPELFPAAEIAAAAARVLAEQPRAALQYSTTEGHPPLREMLVRHMSRYGVSARPQNVLVTSGSQQALDLVGKLLIDPGDLVVVEEPTYLGALQAFNAYQPRYLSVRMNDEGVELEGLERALRAGPKFLYLLPNFQNPAGVTMSLARRQQVVELASRYGVPILEDDPYGQLRYEGEHLPPLVRLDAELHGANDGALDGNVIYLGTLSKTLAPGLRIGWVVAPAVVIDKLVQVKQGADLHTSTFAQMVAHETAKGGFVDRHVRVLRSAYRERRDAMLAALARHMPTGTTWTRPAGGLFLWATLPAGLDSREVLKLAVEAKVAYVPGQPFHANGGGERTLRLNFSYCSAEVIEEGVRRLGLAVSQASSSLR